MISYYPIILIFTIDNDTNKRVIALVVIDNHKHNNLNQYETLPYKYVWNSIV